eukprot:m.57518 g.57518  ORF g.57518 m.57518 type:complete len:316 (+) comp17100_c1_seq1:799-1746(+)
MTGGDEPSNRPSVVVVALPNRRDTQLLQVAVVLAKCFDDTARLGVLDVVLLARLLDNLPDVGEVAVVDAREQVVLDLQVQATGEEEGGPPRDALVHKGVRRDDLVLVKVPIRNVDALACEVVHLGRHHEAERHEANRDERKAHCAEEVKHEELPHVAQAKDQDTTGVVLVPSGSRVLGERHGAVVLSSDHQLDRLEEVHRKRPDEPDRQPCLVLVRVQRFVAQRLGVALKRAVVVEVWVTVRHVGVGVVANNVLVVPYERGRKPPPDVGGHVVDPPVTRDGKVRTVVERVDTEDPVGQRRGQESPPLAANKRREG